MQNEIPKVELQLDADWQVEVHNFYNINPKYGTAEVCKPYLSDQLLKMSNGQFSVELGWFPKGNFVNGLYHLRIREGGFEGVLFSQVKTPDQEEILQALTLTLKQFSRMKAFLK